MESFYKVLLKSQQKNLHAHSIHYFDKIFQNCPHDAEKIILYINDCYCYNSPWVVSGKEWRLLLEERFKMNGISDSLKDAIIKNEIPEVTEGIWQYIYAQKQSLWELKIVKENLRLQMIDLLQKPDTPLGDKKNANEMLTSLQNEIERIDEKVLQDNQKFGPSGFDTIKKARSVTQLSIVNVD